jgi:glycosyltransferase involved in cell wall biosynthesis
VVNLSVSLDVSAIPDPPAGAGRYVLELVRALERAGELRLFLLARRGDGGRWARVAPGAEVVAAVPSARPARLLWEQLALPRLLRRLPIAAHHSPHYTMPERARPPVVVTIHDCTYFDHPEWHERTKGLVFRRAIRVAGRRAAELVCVSGVTAAELERFASPAAPVSVIPHGVDHGRFRPDEPAPGADATALAGAGIREPFIAFVGTIEPRKDVPTLIAAFSRVAGDHPDLRLVVAGRPGWGGATTLVDQAIAASPYRERVVRTGYLAEAALPAVLRRAAVVAYPSLAEGFGLPALEALACGAPLVTTAGSAMAEVAGEAARLVPPGDAAALSAALADALAMRPDPSPGLARAGSYTWEACAEAHLRVYRRAADRLVT